MKLPENSVGITDVLTYRECGRKFEHGMRRHTEGSDAPGDRPVHPAWQYGTVVHDGISWIEEDMLTDEEAVDRCFEVHGAVLEPEDADRLREDFKTYRSRDESGVITVANEKEIRLALFDWCYDCRKEAPCDCDAAPETIYFRGRIDRLYQNAQNPSVFYHRDYKSSRWRTSEEEIHEDRQLWMYNAAIHRYWPECDDLTQMYDQLRYGATPTRKTGEQRAEIWAWFKRQVKAILLDDELEPTHNEWCPWCPIMESCSEVRRLSEWAIARIEELAPNSGKLSSDLVAEHGFEEYVQDLDLIALARKMCERYEESVRGELKKLPDTRLDELGYKKSQRSSNVYTPEALRAVLDLVGIEKFLLMVSLPKTRVESVLGGEERQQVLGFATKVGGAMTVAPKKKT